jgi:L-threonylcarbamoyladenylate synthase
MSMPIFSGFRPADVQACARHLACGELVAFATETVYGLGANAQDDAAVARIFAAKGRPSDHPLIVHVASLDAAWRFCQNPGAAAQSLMAAFWPGPLTLIVPRMPGMATAAAGGQGSIGLRMPAHPVALALLREAAALGVWGVAAPSANRFGRVSPTKAAYVVDELGGDLWVLDGGPCDVGIESTIVDCTQARPALLRPGQLGWVALQQVLGQPLGRPGRSSPRAPGTLPAHYAPSAPLRLLPGHRLPGALAELAAAGQGAGVYSRHAPGPVGAVKVWHPMPATAAAVAHELFGVLREFDSAGVARILVEQPPDTPEWDGVRDRLQRAAAAFQDPLSTDPTPEL